MTNLTRWIQFFVSLYNRLYNYRTSRWLRGKWNVLYTYWISVNFGTVGDNCFFEYPLRFHVDGCRRIRIGNRVMIASYTILGCFEHYGNETFINPEIIIGDDCHIDEFCHISAINKITLGNGVGLGRFVYVGDNSHGGLSWEESKIPPTQRRLISKGEIKIGNNVFIGDKSTIISGVTIGDNVIVGANSVVTHSIPDNCMVAGAPAKIIKKL